MYPQYNPKEIESKWQREWQNSGLYHVSESEDNPKYYCLDFFPYPSGDGLHVGHCRNYVPTDVLSRYKGLIEGPTSTKQAEVEAAAFDLPKIKENIDHSQVVDVIYVPGKIINFLTVQSSHD